MSKLQQAVLLAALQLAACDTADRVVEPSALRVAIYSDIPVGESLKRVEVEVLPAETVGGQNRHAYGADELRSNIGSNTFLTSLDVRQAARAAGAARIRVSGFGTIVDGDDQLIVQSTVTAQFKPRSTQLLRIWLGRACLDQLCDDGESCVYDNTGQEAVCQDDTQVIAAEYLEPGGNEMRPWIPGGYDVCGDGSDGACPPHCAPEEDPDCGTPPPPVPPLLELGAGCTTDRRCRSGYCVDGSCCDQRCDGACEECSQAGECSVRGLDADPLNCGACGNACSTRHATPSCEASTCILACHPPYDDCSNGVEDGCETNLDSNLDHCGACESACATTNIVARCTDGLCDGSCMDGFADCDEDKRKNGCETSITTPQHCGSCTEPPCRYGYCDGRKCEWHPHNAPTEANDLIGSEALAAGTVRAIPLLLGDKPVTVRALGAVVDPQLAGAHIRLAIYEGNDVLEPHELRVQTDPIPTVDAAASPIPVGNKGLRVEGAVRPTALAPSGNGYFIAVSVSQATRIFLMFAGDPDIRHTTDLAFAEFPPYFPIPDIEIGRTLYLYVVTTPQ
jgi:hypothetical protein